MTGRATRWVLQWGPRAGGHLDRVVRPARPWTLTLHYPPGVPLWIPLKGEVFLRGWAGPSTRTVRAGRWLTRGGVYRPGRWADRSGVGPAGVVAHLRPLGGVHRPRGYDFARWGFPLRGTQGGGWSAALTGEDHLLRPRYV